MSTKITVTKHTVKKTVEVEEEVEHITYTTSAERLLATADVIELDSKYNLGLYDQSVYFSDDDDDQLIEVDEVVNGGVSVALLNSKEMCSTHRCQAGWGASFTPLEELKDNNAAGTAWDKAGQVAFDFTDALAGIVFSETFSEDNLIEGCDVPDFLRRLALCDGPRGLVAGAIAGLALDLTIYGAFETNGRSLIAAWPGLQAADDLRPFGYTVGDYAQSRRLFSKNGNDYLIYGVD